MSWLKELYKFPHSCIFKNLHPLISSNSAVTCLTSQTFIPLYPIHTHATKHMFIQTQTIFKDYLKTVIIDLFYMAATPHLQMCLHMHFHICNIALHFPHASL
jgi:hypothetical protein